MVRNDEILVICGDPVPLIECPVSGAALRAYGLGQALRSRGFKVTHAYWPKPGQVVPALPDDLITFQPSDLTDILIQRQPRVVIFQHWSLLLSLRNPAPCPMAIDLHGPLLIEMAYQQRDDFNYFLHNKARALSMADYWTCAGYRQQHYFRAWLLAAGVDIRSGQPDVIPISLSPQLPEKHIGQELTFVFGGLFLPWQDPSRALLELVRQLDTRQNGRLQIFGGTHPAGEIPSGVYTELMTSLQRSKHVQFMGMLSRQELLEHYLTAHVAVDLMARNPERELAFTTRTVEYLWCGLPPIYNNYADLSDPIARAGAGWIVDLDHPSELETTIAHILDQPEAIEPRIHAARQLAFEQYNWEKTITPLAQFCDQPYRLTSTEGLVQQLAHNKKYRLTAAQDGTDVDQNGLLQECCHSLQQLQDSVRKLQAENDRLKALEARLHSFLPYRIYKKVKGILVETTDQKD
ncbi:glycosyltransferase [bacterium]|nr:glycosyltransferase [bacterium]